MQSQLDEQEKEAQDAIDKWQESCSTLEQHNNQLREKEERLIEQLEATKKQLDDAKAKLKDDEVALALAQGKPPGSRFKFVVTDKY